MSDIDLNYLKPRILFTTQRAFERYLGSLFPWSGHQILNPEWTQDLDLFYK